MIFSLLAGILVGIILAMPPGPVAVTVMKVGLDRGLKQGTMVALGTGLLDFFYCLAAIFTTSAVLIFIENFSNSFPILMLAFQLAVVAGILIYGIIHLKTGQVKIQEAKPKHPNKFYEYLTQRGPFLLGVAVSMTNVANPTFLPSLGYISLNVHKLSLIQNSALSNFLFSVGFGVGNFLWLYLFVRVLIHYQSRMSTQFLAKINRYAGLTLIGCGTILGYRILTLTKWSEVLRFIFAF